MADSTSADVPMKFWLRAESKPHEQRTPLTPYTCKQLLAAGKIVLGSVVHVSVYCFASSPVGPVVVFLCWICLMFFCTQGRKVVI